MKKICLISLLALVSMITLSSCSSSPITDLDKHFHNCNQAIEELYNNTPSDLKLLKEAVKFKESEKFSDYQKDEFFKQLKQKNFKVVAKKAKVREDYTEVTCDMTLSDGSTKEKKFRLVKEDNVWKTIIGFSELQDVINK